VPGETPVPSVGKRMKCSARGSRKIDKRPELYPRGRARAVAVSSLRGEAMVVLIEVLAILALVAIVIWWLGLGRNADDDGDAR
jgi:hypothetical protein